MNSQFQRLTIFLIALTVTFTACEDSGNSGPAPVEAQLAEDIQANYNTTFSPAAPESDVPGDTENNPGYTFYDLDAGTTVDDSSSADWDLAFGGTTILANSGNNGGIQVIDGAYADVTTAPEDGYAAETESSSWYTYDFMTHTVSINEDKTIVLQTPDGKYAKVGITSYYHSETQEGRFFTFNYTLQNDNSTQLYHEDAFTYYDLDAGEIVEDSLSSQWDIAFNATNIIANGGNGGGILSLNIAFEDVDEAPVEGFQPSLETAWYTYTGEAPTGPKHAILPKDGVTLVVLTPEGKYAKVKILSYYEGNPDPSSPEFANFVTRPSDRHYTFEYAVQTDGSVYFE